MAFQDLFKKQSRSLGDELQDLHQRLLPLYDPNLVSGFMEETRLDSLPVENNRLIDLVKEQPEDLQKLLTGRDSPQMENLEMLADLFAAIGKKAVPEKADIFVKRALELYSFITDGTSTFSFSRGAKVAELKKIANDRK